MKERIYQHKYAFRNLDLDKSATIVHSLENDHEIKFEDSKVIEVEKRGKNRKIKEAIYINGNRTYNNIWFDRLEKNS